MRLKPINDKIVIKEIKKEDEKTTAGGIILPDTVQDGTLVEGKVVAASEGMYSANGELIPLAVSKGDVVLYNKNAHRAEHKLDGETYLLISTNEVLSIVLGEENEVPNS